MSTRIPSPEVRERLSRVTAADLAAELELRRAQDIRNENRYQREQGWLDVVSRMREALDMESSPTVSRGSVIDWLNTIHDRLRDLPVPKLPDQ